jgi:hypothetical protein
MKPEDRRRTENEGKRPRKGYKGNELYLATGNELGSFMTRALEKYKGPK